ncbi:MAG: trigger factor family protein, partial [Muribaculaceae bacterium]|nr:trigger factor family protein [Muribaculaceae bacterium]
MNVTLENINPTTAKIVVNVVENDYKDKFDAELKKISRTHNIPGFRKGHVPAAQLQRMFGKQVKSDILNNEVFNAVITYLRDNKVNVLGEPLPVEMKEISLADKDYTFEYEIGLAPEINYTLDKSTELPYYVINVDDEMRTRQDEMLRERFGSQQPGEEVEPRAVVKGVMMELDADGNIKEGD